MTRHAPDEAVIENAAKARAARNGHDEIAAAASRLLDHLDAVAADR